jgi:CRP-like cAMP-binding protein
MSILDSEPRSATVTALEDLIALRIAREDFAEIISGRGEIAQGIIKVLTHRLRQANKRS